MNKHQMHLLSLWQSRVLAGFLLLILQSTLPAQTTVIFGITNTWRYQQTSNLNSPSWQAPVFNDSSWPSGPGLLYSETNAAISPRNTPLTLGRTTYYFRTHFTLTNGVVNAVLTFSNRIDDGAVFYINGNEVQRVRMPLAPTNILYDTLATTTPSGGDATAWEVFGISATNAIIGDNVLAAEVHQTSSNSTDIVFGSALSFAPLSVTRGPYLQCGLSTNVIVRWRTDLATESVVRFGTNLADLSNTVSDPSTTTEHELTLNGLSADTIYFYSIGTASGALAGGDTNTFFLTAPVPGTVKPTRLWVVGDAGTGDTNQMNVRDAYYNFTGTRHTDLWLMLGDNAYDTGTDTEFQEAVFEMYSKMLSKSVLWPTLGNHETAQATNFVNTYPYFNIFTLPTNGVAGGIASGTEHYYSFDYANIHFVCLDSMTASRATNAAMATWLRTDLDSTTNRWLIAFWHHPPYTKGSHNSDTETELKEMRQNYLPILEAAGVDLILSGHSHSYERSVLLDGHYDVSTTLTNRMVLNATSGAETNATGPYTKWTGEQSNQGAVYVVAGSSGKISGGALNHPAMFISLNQLGSMVIDVDGDKLTAKFLRDNGNTNDQFTIVKRDVQILSPQFVTNGFRLSVTNIAAGKTNLLQASTTLSNWVSISTNVVGSNSFTTFDATTNADARFYRVLRFP
ncbi:MAG: uncharacterized protein JWM68_3541 [Verrucomicrobiales bacterium]|nr:uncharacterized protein [Verrucomicrobiales bacterium]